MGLNDIKTKADEKLFLILLSGLPGCPFLHILFSIHSFAQEKPLYFNKSWKAANLMLYISDRFLWLNLEIWSCSGIII
jgi:hypothetical protein